jgi:DNA-binding GntR family transcriptional regulator
MANVAWPATSRPQHTRSRSRTDDASLIPSAVIVSKKIGPGAKLVYSKLLDYAATGETATNNRLASDLAVSPRSVRNYVAELKAAGLVRVRQQPGKPNAYLLTATL